MTTKADTTTRQQAQATLEVLRKRGWRSYTLTPTYLDRGPDRPVCVLQAVQIAVPRGARLGSPLVDHLASVANRAGFQSIVTWNDAQDNPEPIYQALHDLGAV